LGIDLCGRGDSAPLLLDNGYGEPNPRLDVIGTSMAGILGMHLAAKVENKAESFG
jgi:hypothetical protein